MKYTVNLDEFIPTFINNYYELRYLDRMIAHHFYRALYNRLRYLKVISTIKKKILNEVEEIMGNNVTLFNEEKHKGSIFKTKPPTWGKLINNLKQKLETDTIHDHELIEDCQTSMVFRMYQIGMGNIQPGFHELGALTTLLNNSVAETENIMELLEDEGETYNLDSAEGINSLATRVVTLYLEGYLSLKTAERTFNILQKKITFSETAHLLPTFEQQRSVIQEAGQNKLTNRKKNEEDD